MLSEHAVKNLSMVAATANIELLQQLYAFTTFLLQLLKSLSRALQKLSLKLVLQLVLLVAMVVQPSVSASLAEETLSSAPSLPND